MTPVKLAGLTVISAELPNIASRADREADGGGAARRGRSGCGIGQDRSSP